MQRHRERAQNRRLDEALARVRKQTGPVGREDLGRRVMREEHRRPGGHDRQHRSIENRAQPIMLLAADVGVGGLPWQHVGRRAASRMVADLGRLLARRRPRIPSRPGRHTS